MTAAPALTRFAETSDARDWASLRDLLAPGFTAQFVHTGQTFDRDGLIGELVEVWTEESASGQ